MYPPLGGFIPLQVRMCFQPIAYIKLYARFVFFRVFSA